MDANERGQLALQPRNPILTSKLDNEFKQSIVDFLSDQRTLIEKQARAIDEQSKYTTVIKCATIVMAIAMVISAACTVYQIYHDIEYTHNIEASQLPHTPTLQPSK